MKKSVAFTLSVLLVLAVMAGCSKRPEGLPELYPTEITITTPDGTPIPNAFVKVADPAQPINYTIGGSTDTKGVAKVQAQLPDGSFVGAPAGKLKVTVSKSLKIVTGEGSDDYTTGELFDAKLQNLELTPLEMEVSASGDNKATFACEVNPDHADRVAE